MKRFADHVVLVTGGGIGIGASVARAFANEGTAVVVADADDAAAKGIAFLASSEARPMTGAIVPVDGGYSAGKTR